MTTDRPGTADAEVMSTACENPVPRCGEDFCDRCGDCLACYGSENCWAGGVDNGSHVWIREES
jgi:hypothetical protein